MTLLLTDFSACAIGIPNISIYTDRGLRAFTIGAALKRLLKRPHSWPRVCFFQSPLPGKSIYFIVVIDTDLAFVAYLLLDLVTFDNKTMFV